ncbi:hypothetical protein F4809DRAFT_629508 [Biscogniauxia mediterranea]|nr:hypothetical protein F4809DRAFT_629508 [Biscogniauxia mediterranea]
MMDNSGVMQYDSRPANNAIPERPPMPSPYVMAHAYTMPPMPPMTTVQAPQYSSQNHFGFGSPYSQQSSSTAVRQQERHSDERSTIRLASPDHGGRDHANKSKTLQARNDENRHNGQSRRSSIKAESLIPDPRSLGANMKEPKTIVANAPEGAAKEIAFHTEVDVLMQAIQLSDKTTVQPEFVASSYPSPPRFEPEKTRKRPSEPAPEKEHDEKEKKYVCRIKNCGKRFSQRTHLDVHHLAHTGEKPHKCPVPGCERYFTQKGNMRTHERRHTGEKPFKCPNCDKRFAQRGNVTSHQETHLQSKKFRCVLEGCTKRFGQLGNLKNHHNNSHKDAILELTRRFSNLKPGDKVSDADRELFQYFAILYKNSNKGIKGRGKGCNVEVFSHKGEKLPEPGQSQHFVHQNPPLHQLPQHIPFQSHPNLPMGVNHFSVPRNGGQPHNMLPPRYGRGPPYDMYEMEQSSSSSGTLTPPSSGSPSTIYEENHTFQDRMY